MASGDNPSGPQSGGLAGWRILITGASRGIGRAVALDLAAREARPLLAARDWQRLDSVREQICSAGGQTEVLPLDLARPGELEGILQPVQERDPIDGFICCAASSRVGLLEDEQWAQLGEMLTTNIHSPIRLTQLILPGMIERGRGLLVYFSSLAVIGLPASAAYGASKGALLSFSRCLRNELAGTGVRVLHVVIGAVDTDMRLRNIESVKANLHRFRLTLPLQAISDESFARQFAAALEGEEDEVVIGDDCGLSALHSEGPERSDELFQKHFERL